MGCRTSGPSFPQRYIFLMMSFEKNITYIIPGWLGLCFLLEITVFPLIGLQFLFTLFLPLSVLALVAIQNHRIRLLSLLTTCLLLLCTKYDMWLWNFIKWLPCVCMSFFIHCHPQKTLPVKWDYLLAITAVAPFLFYIGIGYLNV